MLLKEEPIRSDDSPRRGPQGVVKAFHVPVRDRYQVYQAHPKGFLVIQDTGLNISRTDKALIITVVSKMRDEISEAQILQGINGAVGKLSFDRSKRRCGRNHREFGGGLELWKTANLSFLISSLAKILSKHAD